MVQQQIHKLKIVFKDTEGLVGYDIEECQKRRYAIPETGSPMAYYKLFCPDNLPYTCLRI
jgi:hypothetical protein